jgi:SWI/SNF-related matrix-associated actin-dependent regulator 1 of chromatin subfamily A
MSSGSDATRARLGEAILLVVDVSMAEDSPKMQEGIFPAAYQCSWGHKSKEMEPESALFVFGGSEAAAAAAAEPAASSAVYVFGGGAAAAAAGEGPEAGAGTGGEPTLREILAAQRRRKAERAAERATAVAARAETDRGWQERLTPEMRAAALPYQLEAVAFALEHRRVMIADEPGMGKTFQALAVATAMRAQRVLVVCPLNAAPVWAAEARRWSLFTPLRLKNPRGPATPDDERPLDLPPRLTLCIVTYDTISQREQHMFHRVRATNWDLVVADESHMLLDRETYRSRAIALSPRSVLQRAPAALLLTGTPQRARPRELWVQLRVLFPSFMDYDAFVLRFCAGVDDRMGGVDDRGSSNADLLYKILSKRCLTRTKAGLGLPPKRRVLTRIAVSPAAPGAAAVMAPYRKALADYDAAVGSYNAAHGPEAVRVALERLQHAKTKLWLVGGQTKTNALFAPAVLRRAAEPGKVVFFAHQDVVREWLVRTLAEAGHKPVHLHGGTPGPERARIVALLADPASDTRVGVFSIMACGVAATLSPGVTRAVFWELVWSPGSHDQSEDRIHRLNTTMPVTIEYVALAGSVDEEVLQKHGAKRIEIAQATRGATKAEAEAAAAVFFDEKRVETLM